MRRWSMPVFAALCVLSFTACGSNVSSPLAPTNSLVSRDPAPAPAVVTIAVEFYAGAPVADPDYCFAGCPSEVVIPRGAGGVYRLKADAPHTLSYTVWLSPAQCCVAGEATYDWTNVVSSFSHQGPVSVGIGSALGFVAPPADGFVHHITMTVRAGTVTSAMRIPVEGVR
jgi:hypothetical protein